MTKVVENTYRAVNIAFANELSRICRHDNMDVYEIIKICNMHPRVNILQPGPGVGGHCISVDPWFLVGDYPQLAKVIDESMKTNDYQPVFVLERIHEIMKEHNITDNRRVGLYGLTYKENVDDVRESPTLQMLDIQERHLARPLKTFDPFFTQKEIVKNQILDFDQFLDDVDMVVVMVKHDHIKQNWDKDTKRVERRNPYVVFAQHSVQTFFHLSRRFVGKRYCKNIPRKNIFLINQICDSVC